MENKRYSTVAIVLHWTIAILILSQIASGLYMHKLPNISPIKFDLYQLHKSFGLSILSLSLLRLGWRFQHKPPGLPVEMPDWQKFAARITHVGFYVLMIATPLAGLAIVSVSPTDIPTKFFGVIPIPHLPFLGGIPDAEEVFEEVHEYFAFGILFLLALHVGAALKHEFINKDGVVRSMMPAHAKQLMGVVGILVALGIGTMIYLSMPEPALAADMSETVADDSAADDFVVEELTSTQPAPEASIPDAGREDLETALVDIETSQTNSTEADSVSTIWIVDYANSQLGFVGEEKGRAFEGTFGSYQAEIVFDPDNLEASTIRVDVVTKGTNTGDQLRDSTIPGKEWFDVKNYPAAYFNSSAIRNVGGDSYEADGVLQIKTYELPITLAFSLVTDGDRVTASGGVNLIRTDYGLGLGSGWIDDEDVSLNVYVEFVINATRQQ